MERCEHRKMLPDSAPAPKLPKLRIEVQPGSPIPQDEAGVPIAEQIMRDTIKPDQPHLAIGEGEGKESTLMLTVPADTGNHEVVTEGAVNSTAQKRQGIRED